MEGKPKIGAPSKGAEKKQQITISVPAKIVKQLGVDKIREVASKIINMAYEQSLKQN